MAARSFDLDMEGLQLLALIWLVLIPVVGSSGFPGQGAHQRVQLRLSAGCIGRAEGGFISGRIRCPLAIDITLLVPCHRPSSPAAPERLAGAVT